MLMCIVFGALVLCCVRGQLPSRMWHIPHEEMQILAVIAFVCGQ